MRLTLFFAGLLLSFSCFAQSFTLSRTYDNAQGELGRSVWAITQDQRGVLYLATELGVVEYDGARFYLLDTPPAFGIITDSTGVIYVSCKDDFGQLVHDDKGVVHYQSLFHFQEPVNKFEDVNMAISANKVMAVSYLAALEYDRKKKQTTIYKLEDKLIFSHVFIHNDTTYTSVVPKGLHYLLNGKVMLAPYGDWFAQFHNGKMNASLPIKKNQRLVAFGPHLIKYFGKASPPQPFHLSPDFLKGSHLYSSISVNAQQKILTTLNKGAVLFDTSGIVLNIYDNARRFPGTAIPNGWTDRTGNIWLGYEFEKKPLAKTESGMDIHVWNELSGLNDNLVPAITIDQKVYLASEYNLFEIVADGSLRQYANSPKNFVTKWMAFKRAGKSSKLIGILDQYTVAEYKGGRMENIYLNHERVRILQSKRYPNRLYILDAMKFGYLSLTGEEWKYHEVSAASNFQSFAESSDGTLWFLTREKGQIVRLEISMEDESKTQPIHYFTAPKDPSSIRTILSLRDQLLFISDSTIYQFNQKNKLFEAWHGVEKRMHDLLLGTTLIERDTLNDILYLVSNHKLISISTNAKGKTVYTTSPYQRFENIGTIQGLMVDTQGVLWVTGSEGVISYDRQKDQKNYEQEYPCLIRSVIAGNDNLLSGGGLAGYDPKKLHPSLPYFFDRLSISYAAPFFDKEEETLYSHRLVGRDKMWSPWEKNAVKEYNDLFEGTYTFEVKALNIYGKESSIAAFQFTILPPWYRSWWMYMSYVAALVFFISLLLRWRTRSMRRREKMLQEIVRLRTAELEKTNLELKESHQKLVEVNKQLEASEEELKLGNEELSATNEHLLQMQKQLVEKEKLASLGQLTAGIAHEINNPINFISGGVQALEQLYDDLANRLPETPTGEIEEMKAEAKNLMTSINNGVFRTSEIIRSLRTFSSPVDIIDESGQVDISDSIHDALTLLRDKTQKAQVQVHVQLGHTHGTKANASQLTQVFVNLIDNAVFALQKRAGERIIQISTSETNEQVVVKVKDNAGGIPPALLDRIFEPFFTTKQVGEGTGLGLWICYSIIEKNHGNITVVSNSTDGTEFKIVLPLGQLLGPRRRG